MRIIFIIFLNLIFALNGFSTAQYPDLLVYKGDTIKLFTNPLESFYSETNKRPSDLGVGGCWSTACWRGYQATWELKDGKYYLNELADCCFWDRYAITKSGLQILLTKLHPNLVEKLKSLEGKEYDLNEFRGVIRARLGKKDYKRNREIILNTSKQARLKADLRKLFGENYENGQVFAFWFTGELIAPKGKLVQYIHMGYMSRYEKELRLTIENGILVDEVEYENKTNEIKKGFGVLQATSYSVVVPREMIPGNKDYIYALTDTISYSNNSDSKSIEALSRFNNGRKEGSERKKLVEQTIDSLTSELKMKYDFKVKRTEKLRWGTACWVDGSNVDKSEQLRILTMSNINIQVIVFYKEQEDQQNNFIENANYLTYSVRLMEFGY